MFSDSFLFLFEETTVPDILISKRVQHSCPLFTRGQISPRSYFQAIDFDITCLINMGNITGKHFILFFHGDLFILFLAFYLIATRGPKEDLVSTPSFA